MIFFFKLLNIAAFKAPFSLNFIVNFLVLRLVIPITLLFKTNY